MSAKRTKGVHPRERVRIPVADQIRVSNVRFGDQPALVLELRQGEKVVAGPIVLLALDGVVTAMSQAVDAARATESAGLAAPAPAEPAEPELARATCYRCGTPIFGERAELGWCRPCDVETKREREEQPA